MWREGVSMLVCQLVIYEESVIIININLEGLCVRFQSWGKYAIFVLFLQVKFISVVLIVANLEKQKFPCRDDLNTGQHGLKAHGWLSLSKLCTTVKIWNGWSQATLSWVHNLSVWLLLASIPSRKFSETFNDVLQWLLPHFFNEENSATSVMLGE